MDHCALWWLEARGPAGWKPALLFQRRGPTGILFSMRTVTVSILLLLLSAGSPLAGAEVVSIARLAASADRTQLELELGPALSSVDPSVRAVAARVVTARNLVQLLPEVREQLAREENAEVARELIRAVGLTGGFDEIEHLRAAAARLAPALDGDLVEVAGRLGGPEALPLYLTLRKDLELNNADRRRFFSQVLWGRPGLVTPTSARILGLGEHEEWAALLAVLHEAKFPLETAVAHVALTHPDETIAQATIGYLVDLFPVGQLRDAAPIAKLLDESEDTSHSPELAFARELLRRRIDPEREPLERDDWIALLGERTKGREIVRSAMKHELLTRRESEAAARSEDPAVRPPLVRPVSQRSSPSRVAPFTLFERFPAGLAAAVRTATRCNADIVGFADVEVDAAGRVVELSTTRITTSNGCHDFLRTLLPLGLANNRRITSERSTGELLIARSGKAALCIDEDPVGTGGRMTPLPVGGEVKAPRVVRRVDPMFTGAARRALGPGARVNVIAEAIISSNGCVRDLQLLAHAPHGDINTAALLALSQWSFEPGTLDGRAVDVVFNLTISFSTR
jgi:hypothetical protein